MKAYPMYTATPLPWLPQLPVHWELLRNKNIFQETKEIVGDKADLYPLLSLTTKGIILRDTASGKGKFPKDFNTYKIVRQGDMAFCLFDIDETPRTVGLSDYDGMLTGAYTIFHVKNVNSGYVYYYYLSLDNVKALRSLYSGLRKTINTGTFLGTKLPVPPREEQDQIVRFLDWKVSSINRLINIKRKEIKDLESMKQATVSSAVTRGLNPNAPMKFSGVKWLGNIPAHWECEKIGALFTERRRKVSDKEYAPLSVAKIGVVPQLETAVKTDAGDNRKLVCAGDFVINSRSDRKGSCGVSEFDGSVSLINIVLTPRNQWNGRYVHYLMRSQPFSEEFYRNGRGIVADLWTTRFSEMKSILLPVPPREEQDQIVRFLDSRMSDFNRLISLRKQQIVELEDLKTRLISDVVTGKIDVRDVKIPEFNMVEEDIDEEISEEIVEANQKTEAE